jgi:hypothetical protein
MSQANEKSATIDRLKSELNDSQQTIDYFHALLQDNKDINIFDEQSRAYTLEYRNLVMNASGLLMLLCYSFLSILTYKHFYSGHL